MYLISPLTKASENKFKVSWNLTEKIRLYNLGEISQLKGESNYQAKIAVAMQKETLNSVQSAAQKLTNAVQEYKSNLELETAKFSTAFQKYQVVSEDIVRKNSSLLQKYERDIQNYVSKLQNVTSKYTWMEGRMLKLQGEYDAIFGLIAPPPPPKKEERGR